MLLVIAACRAPNTRPALDPYEPVLTMKYERVVTGIRVGTTTLFPYDCEARTLPALCTEEARNVREKGCELYLVDRNDDGGVHRYVFSAECSGNTMCASFGFWILTAGPKGVTASPPIDGCFVVSETHGSMDWATSTFTPPPRLSSPREE